MTSVHGPSVRRHKRPSADLPDVFRGSQAVEQGLLTEQQLRGPYVQRVLRGIYRPSWVPLTHQLKCEAAGLVLATDAQLTSTSAATILGVPLADEHDDVQAVRPDHSAQEHYRGITIRRVSAPLEPGTPWESTVLAAPNRMAFDLAARVRLTEAVARLDAVGRAGLLSPEEFHTWLATRRDNNICHVRQAAEQLDLRAQSIPESVVRVVLRTAGLDVEPQVEVRWAGRFVARVDLAVVGAKVAIEYDGAWHALREQLEKDRRRLNALREAGWVVVHVTAAMLHQPQEIVDAVRRAIATQAAK